LEDVLWTNCDGGVDRDRKTKRVNKIIWRIRKTISH